MFESLRKHRKIIVTGPHRSGTTFTSTAIQYDLRDTHGLVREELCWAPDGELRHIKTWLYEIDMPIVLQAPFISDCCHQFKDVAFIVFMRRDTLDVEASQRRMFDKSGRQVSWPLIEKSERRKYHMNDVPVADMKYSSWEMQRASMNPDNYMTLDYESLREHPLWVDKETRQGFHVRQTHVA